MTDKCMREALLDHPSGERLLKKFLKERDELAEQYRLKGNPNYMAVANSQLARNTEAAAKNLDAIILQEKMTGDLLTEADEVFTSQDTVWKKLNAGQKMTYLGVAPTRARAGMEILQRAYMRGGALGRETLGAFSRAVTINDMKAFQKDTGAVKDMYRALLGGESTNGGKNQVTNTAAGKVAKVAREELDKQLEAFNSAGALVRELKNYAPQTTLPARIKGNYDAWLTSLEKNVDFEKITHHDTGMPLSKNSPEDVAYFKETAAFIYDEMINGPKAKADPTGQKSGAWAIPDMNLRRQHARFFHFKNPDAFLDYNKDFGVGEDNLWPALAAHLQRNAKDIGVMQVLGPRPRDFHASLLNTIPSSENWRSTYTGMFREMVGDNGMQSDNAVLTWFEGTKNLVRSAILGNAVISALTDVVYTAMGHHMIGMRGSAVNSVVRHLVNAGTPVGMKTPQNEIAAAMNMADIVGRAMGGVERFTDGGGMNYADKFSGLSQFTMDYSGLSQITLATKRAFSNGIASDMAGHVKDQTPWSKLRPDWKRALTESGITEGDWAKVMEVDPVDAAWGAKMLPWSRIKEVHPEIGQKFADLDYRQTKRVVNEGDLYSAALSAGRTGNPEGAGGRGSGAHIKNSSMMFIKGFPMQVMRNFTLPLMQRAASGQGKLRNTAVLTSGLAGLTAVGYMVVGIKQVQYAAMNNGGDMDAALDAWPDLWDEKNGINGKALAAAMLQGGAFGVPGDYLGKQKQGEWGGEGIGDILAGPLGGMLDDIAVRLLAGNATQAIARGFDPDEEVFTLDAGTELGNDAINVIERYTPGQVWYLKPIIKGIADGMENMIDPKAEQKREQALERRLESLENN